MIESLTPLKYSDASRQKASRQDWKPFVGLSWHWFRFFPQTSVFTLKIFLSVIETNVASSGGSNPSNDKNIFQQHPPKRQKHIVLDSPYSSLRNFNTNPTLYFGDKKKGYLIGGGLWTRISLWKEWLYGKIMVSNKLGRWFHNISKATFGRFLICFASKSKIAG